MNPRKSEDTTFKGLFYLKIFERKNEYLVTLCDPHLKGKTLEHNGLKIQVREEFYGDMLVSEDGVVAECRKATSINAMGKASVELLVRHGFVHPDSILWFRLEKEQVGHVIMIR